MDTASEEIAKLIDTYFNAYNAARLREACQLFARMIDAGATIGVSLSGALTPAGLSSVLTPLMKNGFIDYISSTGANLYHDLHFDLGCRSTAAPPTWPPARSTSSCARTASSASTTCCSPPTSSTRPTSGCTA